jgi:hypothetical protein
VAAPRDVLRLEVSKYCSAFSDRSDIFDAFGPLIITEFLCCQNLTIDRHSAVIRKQLDWVVEAADRIFADALEIGLAFDEVGERARQ